MTTAKIKKILIQISYFVNLPFSLKGIIWFGLLHIWLQSPYYIEVNMSRSVLFYLT